MQGLSVYPSKSVSSPAAPAIRYFSALSKGEPLPVKERLEMPLAVENKDAGLTPGLLKVLHKQLSSKGTVTIAELREKWKHLGLPEEQLGAILQLDSFGEEVEWMKFLALGCSVLGESLLTSLKQACEILTRDPEGGAARIPFETFSFLYLYLANIDGEISKTETTAFLLGIKEQAWLLDYLVFLDILSLNKLFYQALLKELNENPVAELVDKSNARTAVVPYCFPSN
ncbi:Ropporin-1-like protein [Turdus rufiventris]|nr:Ropporin-1-like protein [Turdus rufiventris]